MRVTASALVQLMDTCLAGHPARLLELPSNRRALSQMKIVCRWWNLTEFASPESFVRVTTEFHAGRRPEGLAPLESYFNFVQRMQHRSRDQWAGN